MPALAARLGVGLASDCTQLSFDGGKLKVRRPVYAGKATAEVEEAVRGSEVSLISVATPSQANIPRPFSRHSRTSRRL